MLCSLCLKNKINFLQLPCNHHICLSCVPQHNPNDEIVIYQCFTCLEKYHLNLFEQKNTQKRPDLTRSTFSLTINPKQQQSDCQNLFCWTCTEMISLTQFIKGRHQGHNVETYSQSLPMIKNKMIEQLQKSLTIVEYLKQNKQNLQQNNLNQNYHYLIQTISNYFQTRHKILEIKKQQILLQVENQYVKCITQVKKQFQLINPSLEDAEAISRQIQGFLQDQLHLSEIDPLKDLSLILDQFTKSIKQKNFSIPELPVFIQKKSITDSINEACALYTKNNNKKCVQQRQKKSLMKHKGQYSLGDKEMSMLSTSSSKFSKIQLGTFEINQNKPKKKQQDKKVNLVERIKGKMKISSILTQPSLF